MTSATPVVDPVLWGRFLLGAMLVLWLPGHVWCARHWRHTSWPLRITTALAAGLLLAPALSRGLAALHLPVQPWIYVPVAVAVGFVLGKWPAFRDAVRQLDPQARGRWTWIAGGACAVAAITFEVGFSDFAAPPHVHDASNHAFLTWRIAQTESIQSEKLFADPYGRPRLPYLVGMHVSAALVARAGGLAPYVSVWLVAALALMLLPLSLAVVWKLWDLPPPALAAAALLVAASRFAPPGVLTWGGFGVVVGMFLAPFVCLLLTRCWTSPAPGLAALAGLGLGTLATVHGSAVVAALLLAGVTWGLHPSRPHCTWRGGLLLGLGALMAIGPSTLASVMGAYLGGGMASLVPTQTEAGKHIIERYLKSGGTAPHLMALWAGALVLAVATRRWRRVAWTSLALGGLALTLGAVGDPISRALATPFYREAWRVQYLQVSFAPALMGWAAAWGLQRLRGRGGWLASPVLPVVLALVFVVPPQRDIVKLYRNTKRSVPFTRADYEHAKALPTVVGPDEWVANDPNDGSIWAMHVSGRHFVRPTAWDLRNSHDTWLAETTASLLDDPWPASARALRDRGVVYAYASDTRYEGCRFGRTQLDADSRFEPVLVGETSTLYRVRW